MNIENTVHIPGFEDRFFIDVTDGTIYSQYKSKYGIKIVNLIKNIAVDYQEWLDRYWLPTVRLCYGCLRSGGLMCYIISGYRTSSKKYIDLDSDMNQVILDNHFIPISNYPMSKSIRFGRNNRFIETIYIFQIWNKNC